MPLLPCVVATLCFLLSTAPSPAAADCCNPEVDGIFPVNLADVFAVIACINSGVPTAACDVNCDGVVNLGDAEIVWCAIATTPAGYPACCSDLGACCRNGVECSNEYALDCTSTGGLFQGVGTSCEGTVVSVVEPGGSIFTHVIYPPAECPVTRAPARAPRACDADEFFLDPWVTPSGLSCHNFGVAGSPAIPADFFGPGSDPFIGQVCFTGVPAGNPFFPDADTVVRRLGTLNDRCSLTDAPSNQIEIVALSLVSVAPISVVVNSVAELWDVAVDLSSVPAPLGDLVATRTHCNGGTYTSTLHVQPRFTFTKAEDPGMGTIQVLDTGLEGIDPVTLVSPGPQDWSIDLPLGIPGANYCSGFHPGYRTDPAVSCDCNENLIRDTCDLETGVLTDTNGDGVPDQCQPALAVPSATPQPVSLLLAPARPSPTRSSTTLVYALGRAQRVTLTIHDVRGRVVRRLVDESQTSGLHSAEWDGKDESGMPVSPTIYFAKLSSEDGSRTTRIAVIR